MSRRGCSLPANASGFDSHRASISSRFGQVDGARGLLIVDRNTVPIALGDCTVSIAQTAEVAAHIVFLHPTHNFVVLRIDTRVSRAAVPAPR
jgi:hypothetical protein